MFKVYLILLLFSISLFAKSFALIVGIDRYIYHDKIEFKNLHGCVNDANAFRDILLKSGVDSKNIKLLTNTDATKANIINSLKEIESKISKGDRFYYYHSGHGTKPKDILPSEYSGGFIVPSDFNNSFESVIYTTKDLKPHFEAIDKKVSYALLVFDTCYSGQNFRGLLDFKNTQVKSLPPFKINQNLLKKYRYYPYKRTFALTATDATHTALEDKTKKRGIFTMALEECIYSLGVVTKDILDSCLKKRYNRVFYFKAPSSARGFPLFELKPKNSKKLKILSTQKFDFLKPFVEYVDSGYSDFELSLHDRKYRLSKNRELISNFDTKEAIKRYILNFRVINWGEDSSNIVIDINSDNKDKDYFRVGDKIKIDISSNTKGYLAIFSINKEGKLFMIEPVDKLLWFDGSFSMKSKIQKPAGMEFLKVFIFKDKNSLASIKVNNKTGEVLGQEATQKILSILSSSHFESKSISVKTVEGD